MVSGIFSTFGRMFIEKTPWKVRKIQNTECIFQAPVPKVVKILIYCINACHMYKTYGRPNNHISFKDYYAASMNHYSFLFTST